MRTMTIFLGTLLILGCSTKSSVKNSQVQDNTSQKLTMSSKDNGHFEPHQVFRFSEADKTPTISELLLKRNSVCALDEKIRHKQLERLQRENSLASATQLLVLSSCRPEMTPGIMRNALSTLSKEKSLSPEYYSLIRLLSSLLNANERVVREQQSIIEQLSETVEELTKIEKDIESRDKQSKQQPEPFSR